MRSRYLQELKATREAIESLKEDIEALHESDTKIGMYMAIDIETGRATLVPIPSPKNMMRIEAHFKDLPAKIQQTIIKNIPSEDIKATNQICEVIREVITDNSRKAIPDC